MKADRLNIAAGGAVLIVSGLGAIALGFTMDPYFDKGFYAVPLWRYLLKAGHTHSMPLALYNLIVGAMVGRLALTDAWKKRCSMFALLSFIMPLGLVLRGLTGGAMTFAPVVMTGVLFFFASAAVLIKGALTE
ncbi:MAG: hypothetical protein L7F78_26780 [Syntrophales bacterium LBB04]|nr:hypothetical protein [Syntrophales bacterium LBB04]